MQLGCGQPFFRQSSPNQIKLWRGGPNQMLWSAWSPLQTHLTISPPFPSLLVTAQCSRNGDPKDPFWGREEERWAREEQRWLREEQRWVREEARWGKEREALLEQLGRLKSEIESLNLELGSLQWKLREKEKEEKGLAELSVNLARLLQKLGTAETQPSQPSQFSQPGQLELTPINTDFLDALQYSAREAVSLPDSEEKSLDLKMGLTSGESGQSKSISVNEKKAKKKRTLKKGSEGDDVKELQVALQKLGFYSGSEDMEFSVFSFDTESAVKTWQASVGIAEDGIVTAELLEVLLGRGLSPSSKPDTEAVEERVEDGDKITEKVKDITSTAKETKTNGYYVNRSSSIDDSERRVYLLGENRWEDPGRLAERKIPPMKASAIKCFACRGDGQTLCTECEGTGELNVEEQFLEWAEEGAKCPYCEGKGTVPCDVCNGKGTRVVS